MSDHLIIVRITTVRHSSFRVGLPPHSRDPSSPHRRRDGTVDSLLDSGVEKYPYPEQGSVSHDHSGTPKVPVSPEVRKSKDDHHYTSGSRSVSVR